MLKKLVFILAAIAFILCVVLVFQEFSQTWTAEHDSARLRELIGNSRGKPPQKEEELYSDVILPQYEDLYTVNPHFAGWLKVPNTHIDYPVVKGDDNDFYLTHDFYGASSVLGTLFTDMESLEPLQQTNWLIYGHTTSSGAMFGDLKKFKEESFYRENPVFQFDTLYEEGHYEVIAVILSKVYRQSDDVFKYYKYTAINSDEEFVEYVENVKALSLYETGVTAEPGDTLLTLSTCDYYVENGRLAVIAKKVIN